MRYYNGELIPRAKELRTDATPQEEHLWYGFLKRYRPKFHRQKVLDHFIADFYCPEAKLVIEIDGSQHYTEQGMAYDEERTQCLLKYQLEVIRFKNKEVEQNFPAVCSAIDAKVKERLASLHGPQAAPSFEGAGAEGD